MADDTEEVVRVLYQYAYSDDSGQVEIKAGDIYRLVEKTNSEWWQVYDPTDGEGDSFFVPAQYVEIVSKKSPFQTLSDLDKLLTFGEAPRGSPVPDYGEGGDDEHISGQTSTPRVQLPPGEDSNDTYANVSFRGGREDAEGEYVNLDQYRDAAGITGTDEGASDHVIKPQVIPQELIQGTIPPPPPEDGTYIKVLLEGLPWDIYKEHTLQRLYYVNRETGERMWKPPRKEKSSVGEQPKTLPSISPVRSPASSVKGGEEWAGIPAEYEQVHDNGNLYFIHKSTQEKWKSLVDQVGRQYFHKLGSSDTSWKLPSSPLPSDKKSDATISEQSIQQLDVNWEQPGQRLSTFGGQSMRAAKTMSTYGQLETPTVSSRASTLPANFTVARPAPVANDRGPPLSNPRPTHLSPSNSAGTLQPLEALFGYEVFGGYLNKAKIAELGKKKTKKNWSQIYVVLQGSNLVFYKDQKSASQKPGSPHGRPEGVLSLQGAHIDFNPPKEFTGKKNTILLSLSSGTLFLFQSDNEKTIREWFTRMKIVANDVSPVGEPITPRDFELKDDKKGMTRSVSSDDSSSLHGVDKNRNLVGIRAKLLNFISRRPTQEDLVKRGIIRDAVFGSRLHELCDREKESVPKFVCQCIAAVESKGLKQDGLYRISGNLAEIQRLRCAVDKDDTYNLYDAQWDVHVLTGSLKLFFRELKEPVFPFHMYKTFLDAIKKETKKDKLLAFKSAVSDLPRCNYFTLKELFRHLSKVIEMSHENRMQVQNVAIVFGPTLLWPQDDDGSLAVHTVFQSKIVEYVLLEYSELFK